MEVLQQLLDSFGMDITDPQWDFVSEDFLALHSPEEIIHFFCLPVNDETVNQVKQILLQIRNRQQISTLELQTIKGLKWILPTPSNNLNSLFQNQGLESQDLYLVYGKARTGKTQFAHALCVQVIKHFQLQSHKPYIIYIDSEDTFRPDRIIDMFDHNEALPHRYLNLIKVLQISDPLILLEKVKNLRSFFSSSTIHFIVIDSLTKIFRLALAQDPSKFNAIISTLIEVLEILLDIAKKRNIPILCTSQVASTFADEYFFNVIPILSATLNQYIKNWILLAVHDQLDSHHSLRGKRYAHLINSAQIAEKIVQFQITPSGIKDI